LEIAGGTGGRRGRLELGGGQAKTEVGEGIVIFFFTFLVLSKRSSGVLRIMPHVSFHRLTYVTYIYSGPYIRLRDKGCERTTMN
jgi:hypothetical protein